jgi:hypothetical protein
LVPQPRAVALIARQVDLREVVRERKTGVATAAGLGPQARRDVFRGGNRHSHHLPFWLSASRRR